MPKEEKRRMPIEKDWFDKNTPAILYGLLQEGAEFNQKEKKLFYPKKKLKTEISELKKILGLKEKRNVTFNGKLKILSERGYLSEDEENYYFPFNEKNLYFLISKKVLKDLCTRTNDFTIKIYIYLAFKNNAIPHYNFTVSELSYLLGYSAAGGRGFQNATQGLTTLKALGYLDYDKTYVKLDDGTIIPNLSVSKVSLDVPKELKEGKRELMKTAAMDRGTGVSSKDKKLFEF